MLEQADCPAVLAEQCFVTNAGDVDRFGDARRLPAGRQSLLPGHLCLFRHHAFGTGRAVKEWPLRTGSGLFYPLQKAGRLRSYAVFRQKGIKNERIFTQLLDK